MDLEIYLEKLRTCPDARISVPASSNGFSDGFKTVHALTAECGISDNLPVLLKCDFEQAVRYFKKLEGCIFNEIRKKENSEKTAIFNYKSKFCLKIYGSVSSFFITGGGGGNRRTKSTRAETKRGV